MTRAGEIDVDVPLLAIGRYSTLVTHAGAGYSACGALALTRWRGDRTREAEGLFLYVRDLDSGARWSAGLQPVPASPERYAVRRAADAIEIARVDDGVELVTTVRLAPEGDAELRRHSITNRGDRPRRLELTTYAEVVLNSAAADASHPAFSKLFVQTEYAAEWDALLARRRARSPEDEVLWLIHLLREDGERAGPSAEHETDRMRFIGRGRSLDAPRALDGSAPLSGTTGNVLDPIVSMRRVVVVAPGATVHVAAIMGAGLDRAAVESIAARYAAPAAIDAVFATEPAFGGATEHRAGSARAQALATRASTAPRAAAMRPRSTTPSGCCSSTGTAASARTAAST